MTVVELGVGGRRYLSCRSRSLADTSREELVRMRDGLARQLDAGERVYDVSGEVGKSDARELVRRIDAELEPIVEVPTPELVAERRDRVARRLGLDGHAVSYETITRRKVAELALLEAFDLEREYAGHDYGSGQRGRELARYRLSLPAGAHRDVAFVTVDEVVAVWPAIAEPRIARIVREDYRRSTPATRRTLDTWKKLARRYGVELNLERTES